MQKHSQSLSGLQCAKGSKKGVLRLGPRIWDRRKSSLKLSKPRYISFTQDVWMAPNCTGFIVITTDFINSKYNLIDFTISIQPD
ncbi:hypothetical protein VP01_390g6 [Puccinia sorghi]|uniref:Uncharacterized protein n=1 Tax=Puccinia sorghi TaxID=27349 RepID=A0A0L6USR6_9BASI|nr:hypothetical protein VP01_390g6 [Puccinia sorghi]